MQTGENPSARYALSVTRCSPGAAWPGDTVCPHTCCSAKRCSIVGRLPWCEDLSAAN